MAANLARRVMSTSSSRASNTCGKLCEWREKWKECDIFDRADSGRKHSPPTQTSTHPSPGEARPHPSYRRNGHTRTSPYRWSTTENTRSYTRAHASVKAPKCHFHALACTHANVREGVTTLAKAQERKVSVSACSSSGLSGATPAMTIQWIAYITQCGDHAVHSLTITAE